MHRSHITNFVNSNLSSRQIDERKEIFGLRKNCDEFPAEASISKFELELVDSADDKHEDITDTLNIVHFRHS